MDRPVRDIDGALLQVGEPVPVALLREQPARPYLVAGVPCVVVSAGQRDEASDEPAASSTPRPAQLTTTGYGRDLMLKASLLVPILVVVRRNRQLVAALAGGLTPTADRLRTVAPQRPDRARDRHRHHRHDSRRALSSGPGALSRPSKA